MTMPDYETAALNRSARGRQMLNAADIVLPYGFDPYVVSGPGTGALRSDTAPGARRGVVQVWPAGLE